jgi:hypothetical protein
MLDLKGDATHDPGSPVIGRCDNRLHYIACDDTPGMGGERGPSSHPRTRHDRYGLHAGHDVSQGRDGLLPSAQTRRSVLPEELSVGGFMLRQDLLELCGVLRLRFYGIAEHGPDHAGQ